MGEYIVYILEKVGPGMILSVFAYLLLGPKLRTKQKVEFKKVIGEKKAEALLEMKDLIADADSIEVYHADEMLEDGVVFGVQSENVLFCATVFYLKESLIDFQSKIQQIRTNHQKYLNREAAACLVFIDKYVMEVLSYWASKNRQYDLKDLAFILRTDIQNWTKITDDIVIRDINKNSVKIESQKDEKWAKTRNEIYSKLYDNSVLALLQNENPEGENIEKRDFAINFLKHNYDKCIGNK